MVQSYIYVYISIYHGIFHAVLSPLITGNLCKLIWWEKKRRELLLRMFVFLMGGAKLSKYLIQLQKKLSNSPIISLMIALWLYKCPSRKIQSLNNISIYFNYWDVYKEMYEINKIKENSLQLINVLFAWRTSIHRISSKFILNDT